MEPVTTAVLGGLGVTALSAIPSIVGSYISSKTAKDINNQNVAYAKELNQQIFEREDTAYQRAVADATAAGFSPLVAAGTSAGQSGGTVSAPQADISQAQYAAQAGNSLASAMQQGFQEALALRDLQAKIDYQDAQADYLRQLGLTEEWRRGASFEHQVDVDTRRLGQGDRSGDQRDRELGQRDVELSLQSQKTLLDYLTDKRGQDLIFKAQELDRLSREMEGEKNRQHQATDTNKRIASQAEYQRKQYWFARELEYLAHELTLSDQKDLAAFGEQIEKRLIQLRYKHEGSYNGARDVVEDVFGAIGLSISALTGASSWRNAGTNARNASTRWYDAQTNRMRLNLDYFGTPAW